MNFKNLMLCVAVSTVSLYAQEENNAQAAIEAFTILGDAQTEAAGITAQAQLDAAALLAQAQLQAAKTFAVDLVQELKDLKPYVTVALVAYIALKVQSLYINFRRY